MIKKTLKILLPVLLAVFSQGSFAWKVMRENDVIFHHPIDPSCHYMRCDTASFFVTRHSVTVGQPFDITDSHFLPSGILRYLYDNSGHLWGRTEFSVFSGRHQSADVFNDVNRWGYILSDRPGLRIPRQLNFAVEGILSITPVRGQSFICRNVVLAQAGRGLENPWYIFSQQGYGMYHGLMFADVLCSTDSGYQQTFRIYAAHYSNHTFDIVPVSHPGVGKRLFPEP